MAVSDETIARLLGLDREADFPAHVLERERPECLLLIDTRPAVSEESRTCSLSDYFDLDQFGTSAHWHGTASRLTPKECAFLEWEGVNTVLPHLAIHSAAISNVTNTNGSANELNQSFQQAPSDLRSEIALSYFDLTRQRRSAGFYDESTFKLPKKRFIKIMRRVCFSQLPFTRSNDVHVVVMILRVKGLKPGVYLIPRNSEFLKLFMGETRLGRGKKSKSSKSAEMDVETLDASSAMLDRDWNQLVYLFPVDNMAQVSTRLCAEQSIGGLGVFTIILLAEFRHKLLVHGASHCRRLHYEAGAMGELLYLEAESEGLRANGMGCYFDNPLLELLALPRNHSFEPLYFLSVGDAFDDEKLKDYDYNYVRNKKNTSS